ncbi:uncharacterized mitochondrial protein AtMg00810-like [Cannabis sativa]|uniref:uncharacterized mitochondrial protein AtMg00810-like n=1 Tax=Cannabis sativa TaxID=3483 RepID=UPI0029CA0E42|nr:uncharacterized mitochondrial protein AtMg00810-like [Cannabis sativa]
MIWVLVNLREGHDVPIDCSHDKIVSTLISQLGQIFALKKLGLVDYFLSIQVTSIEDGILLSQTKYLNNLLHKFQMQGVNSQNSPINDSLRLSLYEGDPITDVTLNRSVVGALQYISVKRILRYLAVTLDFGLLISKASHFHLEAFCDAVWDSDLDDRGLQLSFVCTYTCFLGV